MKKRIVSIILAAALSMGVIPILGACAKKNVYDPNNFIADTSSEKIVKDKITLNMFTMKSAMHDQWEDMYLFKELERRTNIHVEFEEVPLEQVSQLKGLKWEDTKNPVDAFFLGNHAYEVAQNSQNGALRELSGFDEYTGDINKNLLQLYAPNYMEWCKKYPEMLRVSTQADGKIYTFSSVSTIGGETATQYINKKWIDNLNLSNFDNIYVGKSGLPETTDQFYNTLKAFKDYDANGNGNSSDEVPYLAATYDASLNFLSSAFGFVGSGIEIDNRQNIINVNGQIVANPNYNKIVWVPSTNEYRQYIQYLNKLYGEGLMHDGLFTNNETNLTSLGSQGRLGSFTSAGSYFVVGKDKDSEYVALPPLTSKNNNTQLAYQYRSAFDPSMLMIPASTEKYREIIRWMDEFYKLSNEALQSRGKEGEHWRYIENSDTVFDPIRNENLKKWEMLAPSDMGEENFRATITYQAGLGNPILTTIDSNNSGDPYRVKMQNERAIYLPFQKSYLPKLVHTDIELEEIGQIEDGLATYMKNNYGKFIKGDFNPNNDVKWNEFVSNMSAFNYQKLVSKYVVAYNRNFPDNKCSN